MKVGTDAVLLGSWVNVFGVQRILDIGTGCGVIALMLAQRTSEKVKIVAIEPDHDSVIQAMENVSHSPWPTKIAVHATNLANFKSPDQFDLIVSNPPFFINSQLPPLPQRSNARHTHSLSHEELIESLIPLLSKNGRFAIILPTEEGIQFQKLAGAFQLHVHRHLGFFSREGKPQERSLLEFSFGQKEVVSETLVLHKTGEDWSEAYRELTRDFYLKL